MIKTLQRCTTLLVLMSYLPGGWLAAQQPAQMPFGVHPDNPRYFTFRGEPTVLVTSGEHYGLLLNSAFDYEAYFDELAAHGLNHSRVFQGSYREAESSFGITQNTLAPSDEAFLAPWARTSRTHRDGSPIFDLNQWDEAYFKRLRDVVTDAATHGIVLEMTLFSPMYQPVIWDINPMNVRNNVNKVGDCGSQEVFTTDRPELLQVQKAFAQHMVRELAAFDNVYFEICNEPYFGGVTQQWQNAIIDAVVEAQREIGCRKLISVNVANKSMKIESPHPAVSLFNFHYCHPPVAVAENAALNKPIGENETGFRGSLDLLYRTEGWDFMVAGGALYNNLDYSFSVQHPSGTQADYASPGGGSRSLRSQLGILRQTIQALPLLKISPLTSPAVTASHDLVASAIGGEGSYLVYVHQPLPGRVANDQRDRYTQPIKAAHVEVQLPAGAYGVQQLDTRSGQAQSLADLAVTETSASIELNEFRTDSALVITRKQD